MKVLIVDDSVTARSFAVDILKDANFQCIEATSGIEALEKIRSEIEGAIDLILLDLNLPEMSGIDVLEDLKHDPTLAEIPTVVVTMEGHPAVVGQARLAGASAFLVKPIAEEVLVSTLQGLLNHARR